MKKFEIGKIDFKSLILLIVNIFLIAIVLVMLINIILRKNQLKSEYNSEGNIVVNNIENTDNKNDNTQSSESDTNVNKLQSMSEYQRMQYYFTEYINYIEDKNYEKAYDLLYPEFKQQYFPTIESFTQYVKSLYPNFVAFNYNNFQRQGKIYIMTVEIVDPINGKKEDEAKKQRFVFQENDLDNFVLSFQVI